MEVLFYNNLSNFIFIDQNRNKAQSCFIILCILRNINFIFFRIPSENKIYIYIGLLLAFTKTIFDACDGFLARLKNQKSISGHMLDWYGAHVNAIGFQSGMGFYLANNENEIFFI